MTKAKEYRLAAKQGDANAQFWIGLAYYKGQGVPQGYAEAMKWYKLAADQGDARAQKEVGAMYGMGQGVPQDFVKSHMWCNLASAGFSALETEHRDIALSMRERVAKAMTPNQIAEAQRLASEWFTAHPKP